jgi:hypothetical protein
MADETHSSRSNPTKELVMLNFNFRHTLLLSPADAGGTVTPGFTSVARGEASENERDEAGILSDQDITEKFTNSLDENLGAKPTRWTLSKKNPINS